LAANDTQSRAFRFGVNRLSQLIEAGLFDVDSGEADQLLAYALAALRTDPVSSDQIWRLLFVLRPPDDRLVEIQSFLTDRAACIHDWQNHRLWILLASLRFESDELKDLANAVVTNDPTTGEAAGIFIWLQSIGFLEPIAALLEKLNDTWPFQNQRFFLFAASSLPADQKRVMHGKVSTKLLGTMTRAPKKYRSDGVAIAEREQANFSALYEDIRDYS
jgi:hypothetical protein